MLRSLKLLAVIVGGLLIPAAAEAAYTTGAVNIRTGPGTGYPVIVTAAPGAFVNVQNCVPAWCQVGYQGVVGWMSSGYIAQGGNAYYAPKPYYRPPPPPVVYPRPYYPRAYYPPRAYPGPYVYKPYRGRPYYGGGVYFGVR